jgi:ABC-type multidrug transport system fused ATPase/permease subunit
VKKITLPESLELIRDLTIPKPIRRRILLTTLTMAISGLLDLVGVALIGLLSILTVNAATNVGPKPDGRVERILELANLNEVDEIKRILIISLLALSVFLAKTILSVIFLRKLYNLLGRVANGLSKDILNRLIRSDLETVKTQDSQSYLFIITAGSDAVAFGLIASLCGILTDLTLLVAMFGTMIYIDLNVAIASTTFFAFLGYVLSKILGSENRRIGIQRVRTAVDFSNIFLESMGTFREWRARRREDYVLQSIVSVRELQSQNSAQSAFLPNISKFVLEGGVVLGIFLLAASQALSDDKAKTAAVLAIFITAGVRVVPSVLRIQQNFMNYENAQQISKSFFELMQRIPTVVQSPSQEKKSQFEYEGSSKICVSNLVFSYDVSRRPVLDNLSFEINHGEFVALVGKSGSGKSTLVDCLLGLLNPRSGQILIGDTPFDLIQNFNPNYFSYVPQEIYLVKGTLFQNLTWGIDPDQYSEDEVWESLDQVGLKEFFLETGGLNFNLAEKGANLSGGQRQRIGIARALITKPKFLVLDEATNSLDAESELVISNLLLMLKKSCTILVIAHKLETLKSADKILLLKEGKVELLDDLSAYFGDGNSIESEFDVESHVQD